MPKRSLVVALAGALVGISLLLLAFGAHYEGHDDHHISLMLRRLVVGQHTVDIRPYAPGVSYPLTWLYAHAGRVPWYGLYHYLLLTVAFGLLILTVVGNTRSRPWREQLGALGLLGTLVLAENVVIFNFTRPSFFLGAGAVLLYGSLAGAPRVSRAAGALCFVAIGLGLTQRPESMALGVAAGLPLAAVLAWDQLTDALTAFGRRLVVVGRYFLPLVAWAGLGWASLGLGLSPARQEYRRERTIVYGHLDYHLYEFAPRDAADRAQIKLLDYSFFGDAQALAGGALHRVAHLKPAAAARPRVVGKVLDLAYALRTRFWPYLLLLGLNLLAVARFGRPRGRWLALAAMLAPWAAMATVAVAMKAPDRVISPLMQLATLGAVLLVARRADPVTPRREWLLYLGGVSGLALLTLVEVHRQRTHYRERQQDAEQAIAFIKRHYHHRRLVLSQAFSRIDGLSPLRVYDFGTNQLVPLTDWNTLDPAYQDFLREVTGQPTWIGAIRSLAHDSAARWLLPADFKELFGQYTAARYGFRLPLVAQPLDDIRPLSELTRVKLVSYAPAEAAAAR